jgi:putative ABC transport system permease protein
MKVLHSWKMAWAALKKNRLQTTLTMTGMTIGVATVLTMIALGTGAQAAIHDQVLSAGMNLVIVKAGNYATKFDLGTADDVTAPTPAAFEPLVQKPAFKTAVFDPTQKGRFMRTQGEATGSPGPHRHHHSDKAPGELEPGRGASTLLTTDDAARLRKLKGVQYVSSGIHDNGSIQYNGGKMVFTSFHGDDSAQPLIRRGWIYPFGRFFNLKEEQAAANVVVLGQYVSNELFGNANPVGKTITIKDEPFKVIGVVGSGSFMVVPTEGDDQFDAVYLPVTTMERMLKRNYLSTISVTAISTGDVSSVIKAVTAELRASHHIALTEPNDFTVASEAHKALSKGLRGDVASAMMGNAAGLEKATLEELSKTLEQASSTMTSLLTSIAAVSLLVGGIGVMNIMLLSVSQRTREIGIRRAIGARAHDVLTQFLLEAITLSLAGGLLGVILGCLASVFIARTVHWSTSVSMPAIAVSFGVSAAIGIFFGYYPAREASQLLPIVALKAE